MNKSTLMKAWSFETDPWEGTHMIVYADTAGQAKRAAMEYVDNDFTEIRVYRVQWADKYGDYDNIPIDAFLKNGWWWPCHKCGTQVYEDNLGGYINKKEPVCEECWKELNHNE